MPRASLSESTAASLLLALNSALEARASAAATFCSWAAVASASSLRSPDSFESVASALSALA